MDKIRVVVCDDMSCMCEFFSILINNTTDIECIGCACNERDSIALVESKRPDVILLDMQMDSMESGLNLIPKIKNKLPESKIIVISVHEDDDLIFRAIKEGADNYFIKTQSSAELLEIIRDTRQRNIRMNNVIVKKIMNQQEIIKKRQQSLLFMFYKMINLSNRELQILESLCEGKKNQDIASEMYVEEVTIRSHISRILKKMEYQDIKMLIADLKEMEIFSMFK